MKISIEPGKQHQLFKKNKMEFKYYTGPRRISQARELRRNQTLAERILWEQVRNRRLGGYKIRRQHVINQFIVDFYCPEKKLCIEIDGPYHSDPSVKYSDEQRNMELEFKGFTLLRFSNAQVQFEINDVLTSILTTLQSLPSAGNKPLNHKALQGGKLLGDNHPFTIYPISKIGDAPLSRERSGAE